MEWKKPRKIMHRRSGNGMHVTVNLSATKANGCEVRRAKFIFSERAVKELERRGTRFIVGIDSDRIFFKHDRAGYVLSGKNRKAVQVSLDENEMAEMKKFVGEHDLLFSQTAGMHYIDIF